MLKIENTEVIGWEAAIRGMRNPKNSWEKSDSNICPNGTEFGYCYLDHRKYCPRRNTNDPAFCIGPKDLDLMTRLRDAGTDHRKFMRMIAVYLDVMAPFYWWKEFDQGRYIETKDKRYWWQLIHLLPTSYNQKRTVMLNYEVLANIYKSRRNHKLDEWHTFCDWIETLPYSELITEKEKRHV